MAPSFSCESYIWIWTSPHPGLDPLHLVGGDDVQEVPNSQVPDTLCGVVGAGLQAKDAWIPYQVDHWEPRVLFMTHDLLLLDIHTLIPFIKMTYFYLNFWAIFLSWFRSNIFPHSNSSSSSISWVIWITSLFDIIWIKMDLLSNSKPYIYSFETFQLTFNDLFEDFNIYCH